METTERITSPECPFALDTSAANIHAENRRLRRTGPAALAALPGGVPAWIVTDQGLARRLMLNPNVSKDAALHWPAFREGRIPTDWPLRIWVVVRNALASYGEEHRRLRGVLTPFFDADRIRNLAPDIEEITARLLDELEALPASPVDLRKHFAWRLPLSVINLLLGLPEDMTVALRHHVEANMSTHYTEVEAAANARAYYDLLNELVDRKRISPREDLTSSLVQLHDESPDQLSHQELLDSLMLVIGAGHETTVDLLDQAVTNLLRHPEELDKVRSGEATWEDVTEETLRHESPVANIPIRFAMTDIHDPETGFNIPEGDAILINIAALGRDPHVHTDPDTFDVTRATRTQHTTFGRGVHFCIGAALARLEAKIALRALFTRFPSLTFADPATPPPPLESFISNGHQNLMVNLRLP
ncbi:cytochrome P450 [Streptomyces sp. NPDC091416]|uniref:cytochrome P450 family protein n=1 Tax=Streptomyces sp. NPDC091416 TaxID=3366003 RepID=UPI0037FEB6A6